MLLPAADQVYVEMKRKAKDAILLLIEKERDGEQVDRALVKNVLGIFIEVGMGGMECYTLDFQESMVEVRSRTQRALFLEIERACALQKCAWYVGDGRADMEHLCPPSVARISKCEAN
jgi:hypothetical protein